MFHSKIIPNHIDEVFFKWWNFLSELLRGTKVVEGILNLFFITIKNKFVSAILIIPKLKKSLLILTLENIFCLDRYTSTRKYFKFILFFYNPPSFGNCSCVGIAGTVTWPLHLTRPCYVALRRVLIWAVCLLIGLRSK